MPLFFAIFLFLLPLVYTFSTNQVFEINKFTLLFLSIGSVFIFFKTDFLSSRRQNIFLASLVALSFLSSVLAVSPVISFFGSSTRHMGFLTIVALVFVFLISQKLATQKQKNFLITPIVIAGGIIAIYSVYQWNGFPNPDPLFSSLDPKAMSYRAFAFLGQPNFVAQACIIPFFFALHHSVKKIHFETLNTITPRQIVSEGLFIVIFIAIFILMLFATESRAVMLAFLIGLGLYFFKNHLLKIFFIILPFLGWIVTMIFGIALPASERFSSIIARSYFWQDAFSLLLHNPKIFFFGTGFDNLAGVWQSTLSYESYASEYFQMLPDRVHSLFLDIWVQGGIFLLLIIGFGLWKTLQKTWHIPLLLAPFWAMITAWMFGFFVITDAVFFAVLLGIIWSIEKNNTTHAPSVLKKAIVKGVFLILGFFFIAVASVSWMAEKSFFEGKSFALWYTPFLEHNWVALYPVVSENEKKEIREIGTLHHWNSRGFYRIVFLESLKTNDSNAKNIAFQNWWNAAGNNPVEQLKIMKEIKSFGIVSDDEYNAQVQIILEKLPKETDPSFEAQKIWKYLNTL